MKFDPNQYRLSFFAEAADHLSALEAALLRLDAGSDAGAVDEAFRSAHTIKGGADVVGLDAVARLTHALETTLARFRSAAGSVPRGTLDLLVEGCDGLTELLAAERADGSAPDVSDLIARLTLSRSRSRVRRGRPGRSIASASPPKRTPSNSEPTRSRCSARWRSRAA
jgi:two-component system chemotaxis sensor kinase CheA